MIGCTLDEPSLRRLIAEIGAIAPRPHHSALLAAAGDLMPGRDFRHAMTRGGWYRPGGIVRADGTRVAHDLEAWAESTLQAGGGDMDSLLERHAGDGLLATRVSGRTHYFVARFGPQAADFLQLEVEELQEQLDRQLINPQDPPADLPELTDPIAPITVEPNPLGPPYYRFRRLTDMRQAVARQPASAASPSALSRFIAEWTQRNARGHFCEHWILALREHQDRYRNTVLSASPISLHGRKLKSFPWQAAARGVELSEQIQAFDRAAGYPAAWYFHMVAGALTPRDVAFGIARDLAEGYRYLPDADISLLEQWLDSPYAV